MRLLLRPHTGLLHTYEAFARDRLDVPTTRQMAGKSCIPRTCGTDRLPELPVSSTVWRRSNVTHQDRLIDLAAQERGGVRCTAARCQQPLAVAERGVFWKRSVQQFVLTSQAPQYSHRAGPPSLPRQSASWSWPATMTAPEEPIEPDGDGPCAGDNSTRGCCRPWSPSPRDSDPEDSGAEPWSQRCSPRAAERVRSQRLSDRAIIRDT